LILRSRLAGAPRDLAFHLFVIGPQESEGVKVLVNDDAVKPSSRTLIKRCFGLVEPVERDVTRCHVAIIEDRVGIEAQRFFELKTGLFVLPLGVINGAKQGSRGHVSRVGVSP